MKKTLLDRYEDEILASKIRRDVAQIRAIKKLDKILNRLHSPGKSSWWPLSKEVSTKGLYLWGKVGTGKTLVMTLFYDALKLPKMKLHFHRFMKMVHEELKPLQGKKNPLDLLAKKLAKKAKVICFDEFVVTNIVDAMILGNLLKALLDQGIVFIATSNVFPDDLYKGGLQRDKFLPAIEYIKTYTDVIEVDDGKDYRLQKKDVTDVFLSPVNEQSEAKFLDYLKAYDVGLKEQTIKIVDRDVNCLGLSDSAVCFDFESLCEGDRSQLDYIDIAERFEAVFIKGLIAIDKSKHNYISRWISLIDVLYDAKIKMICLSQVPITEIYVEGRYLEPYERTKSRLFEMQSQEYLHLMDHKK